MSTTKEHIAAALASSPNALSPADIHAHMTRAGVDTTVGYVNQVLQKLKAEGDVYQPRPGRWACAVPVRAAEGEPLRWPKADEEARQDTHANGHANGHARAAERPVLFVVRDGHGREIVRWEIDAVQVGPPAELTVGPEREG